MKILVVGPARSDPGGVANYYNAVFPRLERRGLNVQYLEIGKTKGGTRVLHRITDQIRFWRVLGEYRPDIVHLNPSLTLKSFLRDGCFTALAKLRGRRVLIFFRGWEKPFEREVSGKFRPFFRATFARADRFIVLAESFARQLRSWGVSAPIATGTTAVDDSLLEGFDLDAKTEALRGAPVVRLLFLARLEAEKGILELIEAVRIVLDQGGAVTLTIAGEGPALEKIRASIDALGMHRDAVELVGYVRGAEKTQILASHHVYCFPSRYAEGMPNSVLEAMAFGMPLLTTRVGGIDDFFVTGKMGLALTRADADDIAECITSLSRNRGQLAEMSRCVHAYATRQFLASTCAAFLLSLYDDMLKVR